MEAIQRLRVKVTATIRITLTYSHLYEDIERGAPLTFSGSRDPLKVCQYRGDDVMKTGCTHDSTIARNGSMAFTKLAALVT